MTKGLVTFVVLNWNGLDDTLLCLDSIRKQTIHDYEIIVVDNGSADDQKDALRKISDITLIDLPKNTGFTGGQIAAYKRASGQYIALINNDAVIAQDWAEKALAVFAHDDRVAAVGGKAYQWNEALGLKSFSTTNPFYSYQVVNIITGHTRTLTYGDDKSPVNSISGSGVMIRTSVIEACGYFDDLFFAYYEETDLFARFKRAGFSIIYSPAMHTWHKIAQSTKAKPDFYLFQMHRNRFIFAFKNYDGPYLRAFLRTYIKEWTRALLAVIKHGARNRTEQKNLVKAGVWNALHILKILPHRKAAQALGPAYSLQLLDDAAETITVVIPCYNYADYVAHAIDSVLAQSKQPNEIIVINDGSKDNSLAIINGYKDKVRIIDQENQGIVATKNRGIDEATSDWILFLDADDVLHPTYLEKFYAAARTKNADVIYSAMQFTGKEADVFWSRPFSRRSLRKGNYINNSALIRREPLQNAGGYNKAMSFGYEDWELYLNLAEAGVRFAYIREPLLFYRRHSDNSRDKVAQAKLVEAHMVIRQLHPRLFSKKYELLDFLRSIPLFFKERSPLRIVKDSLYVVTVRLYKLSDRFVLLNKLFGFLHLLRTGDINKIAEKSRLNARRVWKKIAK